MSDDLVQRLREEFLVDPSCSSGEAADRIDALEAELRFERDQRIDYSPHAERMRRIQVEQERDEARVRVQFLVDWANAHGFLEDGSFTFPDGDTWHAGVQSLTDTLATERTEAREVESELRAENTKLREALEAICEIGKADLYAYDHHAPFHAAVYTAMRALADIEEADDA